MMFENKDKFVKEIGELLNLYLASRGKHAPTNFYFGKVVDNQDPQKMGRVRVRVFQVFDGLEDEDLPYALPDYSPNGEMVIPTIGSLVQVYFENEDFNFPHYTTKITPKEEVNREIEEDYPHSMIIFNTENGDMMKINKKRNEFTMRLGSGTFLFCDSDGNLEIDATAAETGNINIKSSGTVKIDASVIELAGPVSPDGPPSPQGGFLSTGIDSFTGRPIAVTRLKKGI